MKRIGIVGGLGPESTLDYYKRIIAAFQERKPGLSFPEIVIYSANLQELMDVLDAGDREGLAVWLAEKVEALHRAGADFAVIGSNTPHLVFDAVRLRAPIPMLSIVEETRTKAGRLGLKKLGLLGTKFTMESDFYRKSFEAAGLQIVVPEEVDRELIHHRLFTEIELGIVKDSTRQELLSVVRRMIDGQGIEAVILGCTELPLILDRDCFGIPFLNTTAIHVESIVEYCLNGGN